MGEVVDFFDPTPTIYELTTGKDWDTGEELGGYDRYAEPFLEYLIGKKVGKGGKFPAKLDKKLLGGKVTKKLDEWTQPVREKRDEFVEWACSNGGLLSERAVSTAYADNGGSIPDKECLMQQILGWSGDQARRDRVAHGGYFMSKEFRKRIANAKPAPYDKHTDARTVDEAKRFSYKHAQFLPNVDRKKLEKEALMKAEYVFVKNGVAYFFYDTGKIVGYDNGEPTTWIRAELPIGDRSKPEYHGHPMSKKRVDGYLKKSIRLKR
ncbi:hypothetical protein JQC72_15305 [Polycladomyces sp. WAk]|uniref:Uncharacterized protein n=1 Tax=Polycladomyces zharkentensis TaxID=2807616 RepID=A0ABS2WN43_9BACL|nr:hypothetical protein [Polycladomyces sp. WAk]MBN2910866.1 hypothetical protein [Polycladomyces sp. WAk]